MPPPPSCLAQCGRRKVVSLVTLISLQHKKPGGDSHVGVEGGMFGFNSPLRQYFSIASTVCPYPTIIQISRVPWDLKLPRTIA